MLPQCDRVLVLKEGQMVELGKYKDLMRIPDGVMRGLIEAYGSSGGGDDEEEEGYAWGKSYMYIYAYLSKKNLLTIKYD